jgi:SMODS and SLOG-associating 2TM effector domain 1
VRARAASEALKREAFKSATKANPYDTPAASELLKKERERIEGQLTDLRDRGAETAREGLAPRDVLSPEQYRERRVREQIGWYTNKAHGYRKMASRLRWIEFTLALAATIVTALSGAVGRKFEIGPMQFDIAALTAVLTTVSGAILAHIEASRYQHLVTNYLATASRLEDLDTEFDTAKNNADTWSDFVNCCEEIIMAENNSWTAKWTKTTS